MDFPFTGREWAAAIVASARGFVQSDVVARGFFWAVPLINIISTDATNQVLDLYLADESITDVTPSVIAATGPFVSPAGLYKICPGSGASNGSDNAFASQSGRSASAIQFFNSSLLIVPSGWSLVAVEVNSAISAANHTLKLRILRAIMANGCKLPSWVR
jgi:hypothetical protein